MKVFVCGTCAADSAGFADAVKQALNGLAEVVTSDCMSGCARAQTLAFRSPNKTAYLFGDMTLSDLPEVQNFARLYAASPDGIFPDARILGGMRLRAIARIPG